MIMADIEHILRTALLFLLLVLNMEITCASA